MKDHSNEELTRYFSHIKLPDEKYGRLWEQIIIPAKTRTRLVRYLKNLAALDTVDPVAAGLNKIILLYGPPGTGKSTLARGLANEAARLWGQHVNCLEVNTESLFSEWLGKTAKEIASAFELALFSAERAPTIVLVDEVEALSYARRRTINTSDPTDLIRAVDTLLHELDELRFKPKSLVIATSNFPEVIDDAFWSRVDWSVPFDLPTRRQRFQMLAATLSAFQATGLELRPNEVAELARQTEGWSGRELTRLVFMTSVFADKDFGKLTVYDFIRAIKQIGKEDHINGRDKEGN